MTEKIKTKLVGVRFETDMLEQIDEFADRMGTDRNQVIKIAVQEHIDATEEEIDEELIEDYINLIVTEEEVRGSGFRLTRGRSLTRHAEC